jgi:general stress protein YciG
LHTHHIIPKHSTYFNYLGDVKEDPYYKVDLTIDGHSCQHDILFRVFRQEGDRIARDTLDGQMTHEEATRQARADWIKRNPNHHSEAGKKGGRAPASQLAKRTASKQAKILSQMPWWNNGILNKRSHESPGDDFIKGRLPLWGGKRDQPTAACSYCGRVMIKANLSRHIAARHQTL